MGKGSAPRPFTDRKVFEDNFDKIFGKKDKIKLTQHEACSIETIEALIEIQKEKELKRKLNASIEEHEELYKDLSRMDTIGQNGNDGLHYEYELNKSTGEVEKRFIDGFEKPNGEQFGNESNAVES